MTEDDSPLHIIPIAEILSEVTVVEMTWTLQGREPRFMEEKRL
jgi:hypothetical protein